MKKLISCLVIIAIPLLACSKHLSIGAFIGLNPKTTKSYVPDGQTETFGGRICLSYQNIEFGLENELGHYQTKAIVLSVNEDHTIKYPKHQVHATGFHNVTQLFGNFKLTNNRLFEYYAGVSLGFDLGLGSRYIVLISQDQNSNITGKKTIDFGCHGFSVGVQTGAKVNVTKWLNIQGQIAARGAFLKEGEVSYVPVYFPVSIGLNIML